MTSHDDATEPVEPTPATIDDDELRRFAATFSRFLEDIHRVRPPEGGQLRDRVMEHLGTDPADLAPVGQDVPPVERPNLQLAMNSIMAEDPDAECLGVSPELQHWGEFSFSAVLGGRFRGPTDVMPPSYHEFPVGTDETLRCVSMGIWLIRHDGEPVAVCVQPGAQHERKPRIEVFAATEAVATAVLERIKELRHQLNVYRGQVLAFRVDQFGEFGVTFQERPTTAVDDVILAPGTLESIERHAVEIGRRAPALLAAGQHLKRGLLLYGPPGTGKTHTIGFLLNTMPERTAVILEGASLGALGYAAAIVRTLSPAMLVIEDIDIIATARGHYDEPGHPLLFNLLNEMDGLAGTDDVLFVLTTNRPDVLEPALAARPGRIDHSVEIGLPDTRERRLLLDLYLADVDVDPAIEGNGSLDAVVERTAGVTASFVKELVRRAVLVVLERVDAGDPVIITDADLEAALDELLSSTSGMAQSLFGLER